MTERIRTILLRALDTTGATLQPQKVVDVHEDRDLHYLFVGLGIVGSNTAVLCDSKRSSRSGAYGPHVSTCVRCGPCDVAAACLSHLVTSQTIQDGPNTPNP